MDSSPEGRGHFEASLGSGPFYFFVLGYLLRTLLFSVQNASYVLKDYSLFFRVLFLSSEFTEGEPTLYIFGKHEQPPSVGIQPGLQVKVASTSGNPRYTYWSSLSPNRLSSTGPASLLIIHWTLEKFNRWRDVAFRTAGIPFQ